MSSTVTFVARGPAGTTPVRLTRGDRVSIGRHASNDLAVDDATVSRFHARLSWPAGAARPVVEDLGSANGTRVNGERVRGPVVLDERARLSLGDVTITVELEDAALIADDGRLECRLFTDHTRGVEAGFLGASPELRDLLLDLERARRTGTLLLERGRASARLTFALGRIVDATTDARGGVPALVEALERFDRGRFTFRPDVEPRECPLSVSPRELLAPGAGDTARTRGPRDAR